MLKNKLLTWFNLLIMGIYTIPVAYSIWFVGLFNKFTKAKYYIAQSWTIPWMWAARSRSSGGYLEVDFLYVDSNGNTTFQWNQGTNIINNALGNPAVPSGTNMSVGAVAGTPER